MKDVRDFIFKAAKDSRNIAYNAFSLFLFSHIEEYVYMRTYDNQENMRFLKDNFKKYNYNVIEFKDGFLEAALDKL